MSPCTTARKCPTRRKETSCTLRTIVREFSEWPATAKLAARTGAYICAAGLVLFAAPRLLGLLCPSARCVLSIH
jgi:hypothetical protein